MTNSSGPARGARAPKPTPLGLMILALLVEQPMHPYEMQRLMVARGDDRWVRVQRGSLYPAVERLVAAGFVEPASTQKAGKRPERTVYRITPLGQQTATIWLMGMLSTYKREYPEFGAALSFSGLIDAPTFATAISIRRRAVREELDAIEGAADRIVDLPRVFVLENEYLEAVLRAEITLIDGFLADIADGRLDWDWKQIAAWAEAAKETGRFTAGLSTPPDPQDEADDT